MKSEKPRSKFGLCIRNEGAEDLELQKVYQVLPDPVATREGLLRLIDEAGEDYLYPTEYFARVSLPAIAAKQFVIPPNAAVRTTGGKRRGARAQ
jgi:hypothetical protein